MRYGDDSAAALPPGLEVTLELLVDAWLSAGPERERRRAAARELVRWLVLAGASGAELWRRDGAADRPQWRRWVAAGRAVAPLPSWLAGAPSGAHAAADAAREVVARATGSYALVARSGAPGEGRREQLEDWIEALLAVLGSVEADGGSDEPPGPLPAA